jgi:16S rRNA (adenine1518-N6/adenine1519-N6)-dimethyltransferase
LTSTSSRPRRNKNGKEQAYRPRELREQRVSPDKSLGQHFLTDWTAVRRIIEATSPEDVDAFIEVGPGLGALTDRLLEVAPRLIAVEMDAGLGARLRERSRAEKEQLPPQEQEMRPPLPRSGEGWGEGTPGEKGEPPAKPLTVVEADVLTKTPAELLEAAGLPPGASYGFVSNLPYNAGAAIIRHFLEAEQPPRWLVVMLQREVAESICAQPGDLGLLGVSVQVYARARRLFNVPPRAFYPPPKVTSTVIRLDVLETPLIDVDERAAFFETVRAGFSTPRKTVRNSLANGLDISGAEAEALLLEAHLDPAVRPSILTVEDWVRLAETRNNLRPPAPLAPLGSPVEERSGRGGGGEGKPGRGKSNSSAGTGENK